MKIKKIIIVFALTISILFYAFWVQSNKQEAESAIPLAVWVALNVIPALVVGAVIWFTDDDGSSKPKEIASINSQTGEIQIQDVTDSVNPSTWWEPPVLSEFRTWTEGAVTMYPVTQWMIDKLEAEGIQWGWSWITVSNMFGQGMTQSIANSCIGSSDCFVVYRVKASSQYPGSADTMQYRRVNTPCNGQDFLEMMNADEFTNEDVVGGLGKKYSGNIGFDNTGAPLDIDVEMYEFEEDVPLLPNCFDGIQNQDETGIDCGGVCEFNFGLVCPPAETCFDGIMNQDETGIDYGGVCGTGTPVSQPPANFTDNNQDGIDDISGLDSTGSIPVGSVSGSIGTADSSTYDASLPGDVSEVGETDWTGLITGYLASNPLVLLATGSQINVTGATCSLPMTLFGKSMTIDFCSLDWMVDLFGSFVLGLMAIRAVFIAMGV